jgi:hypothetical protein
MPAALPQVAAVARERATAARAPRSPRAEPSPPPRPYSCGPASSGPLREAWRARHLAATRRSSGKGYALLAPTRGSTAEDFPGPSTWVKLPRERAMEPGGLALEPAGVDPPEAAPMGGDVDVGSPARAGLDLHLRPHHPGVCGNWANQVLPRSGQQRVPRSRVGARRSTSRTRPRPQGRLGRHCRPLPPWSGPGFAAPGAPRRAWRVTGEPPTENLCTGPARSISIPSPDASLS